MTSPDPRALDVAWLRAQQPARHDTGLLVDRIREHLELHDGYVSLSGGKDSLVVLDLALRADRNVPVCFFDSGLEFPETITYLDTLETHYGIHIDTYPAQPSLLEVLIDSGAWDLARPSAAAPALDQILIHRPAACAASDHGDGVLWGLRADESRARQILFSSNLPSTCPCCTTDRERRYRHGGTTSSKSGVRYSPIWDWTSHDVWNHITRHQLPVNPAYAKLRALGAPPAAQRISHLVDGDLLDKGRLAWIRAGWPELWQPLVRCLPRLTSLV
ncbi:phosphoadenosine phosphosulfate reductase family protein [Luteococcus sp.]|uniref:phosphoadenosine phosphosulfate reductase family protein n=1 Tax=Luteococcus sp. TaxID=1969402 RepID=UPI003734CF5B